MKKVLYLGMIVFILVILASCIPDNTLPPTTPNAPSNLNAEVISSSEIRLTWEDNSDNEEGFKIERKSDSIDWNEIVAVNADTTTYNDTKLTFNTRYYYRVKAYNQGGESDYSNMISITTLSCEAIKWKFKTAEDIQSSPAIGSDGTIYVGSGDNYLYAINHDGSEKWKFKTDYSIYSSPAIGDDGTIYVASEDSYLYALQGESERLADAPWPKYGKNNRNTGNYADAE